jgi:hypothetical protein
MTPDLLFWLSLALKMAVTAGFVLLATYAAERAGPVVGGMIATLPIAAGPAYLFIALDHTPQFIAESALSSLAVTVINTLFALVYAALAQQHSRAGSILPALAVWVATAFLLSMAQWTTWSGVAFNVVGMTILILLGNRFRHVRVPPPKQYWTDMVLRAGMVAVLVAVVVNVSSIVGPTVTGILAVFPMVLFSLMLILHERIGGRASAAVQANSLLGMAGFSASCLTAHLLVERLGTPAGLTVALIVSMVCNFGFWWLRRRSTPLAAPSGREPVIPASPPSA